jgi:ribosomal protein S27E
MQIDRLRLSSRTRLVLFPPIGTAPAVTVPYQHTGEDAPCTRCGRPLLQERVWVYAAWEGFVCPPCFAPVQDVLSCRDCGQTIRLSGSGVRLRTDRAAIHQCPAAEVDTYAMARQMAEERAFAREVAA